MTPTRKFDVTVLGATGVVGQRFVRRLAAHPSFSIRHLAASDRSTGKRFSDAAAWRLDGIPYGGHGGHVLVPALPDAAFAPIVFSALDTEPARELEPLFAAKGALVFSNASAFRMTDDVPLLIPEVNPEHLDLLRVQRDRRRWSGGIVTNPNCTATVLALALAPLQAAFGVTAVAMTSMQAVSGAGHPGVPSLDILGNVIPFIRNEEAKVEEETPRLLGRFDGERIVPAAMTVTALCYRVPVLEGHTESVAVTLRGSPTPEAVREAFLAFDPRAGGFDLPSAPARPIRVHDAEDRPQVRRDVEEDGGLSIHVGRIRRCPLLGIKFSLLGHNTERGAAGASVLNAELAVARGFLP